MKNADTQKKLGVALLLLVILCFLSFLIYGMYFNGIGTNAAATMEFFNITESSQGMILTVQAVGCLVMTILLGLFGERINKLWGLFIGLVLMAAGAVLIGTIPLYVRPGGGFGFLLGYSLLAGVGYITIDLLMNGVIADVYPERKNTFLPFVHAFYGTGAMFAPIFVTAVADPARPQTFALPYLVLGCTAGLIAVLLLFVFPAAWGKTPYGNAVLIRGAEKQNAIEVFKEGRAWLYFLGCFLYIGFQTGLSAWLPKYGMASMGASYEQSAKLLTVYFLGSLIMRFLSSAVLKRMKAKTLFCVTILASAVLFAVFLLLPGGLALSYVLMLVVGLLQGSAVPCLVIMCCDAFPTRTASASSLFVLSVSIATMVVPGVMGRLIELSGYGLPMALITAALPLSCVIISLAERRAK